MEHFTPLSTTAATLPAFLLPLETVQTSCPSVGLYFGRSKALSHQDGTIYLTSHRLIFVSSTQPLERSGFIELKAVREISFYARFLKSSPKIELEFRRRGARGGEEDADEDEDELVVEEAADVAGPSASATWVCTICGFSNALSASASPNCQLCGVARKAGSEAATTSGTSSPMPKAGASAKPAAIAPTTGLTCPVCTFENHPSMARCEMCDTQLATLRIRPRKADASTANSSQTSLALSSSRPNTPGDGTSTPPIHQEVAESIRLSFRKGGDRAFYAALKAALREKAWRATGAKKAKGVVSATNGTAPRKVGIDGIISAVDGQARDERQDMDDALQDLEALMGKAKRMVELAESLNAKLARQEAAAGSSGSDGEAATAIRSSLLQLGLQTPAVTADMARNEASYHRDLARELAGVLLVGRHGKGGIMGSGSVVGEGLQRPSATSTNDGRGIMGLDEVWCAWNRARGVALVPPQALRSAAVHLSSLTNPPIQLRTLRSGLVVLHTPRYEPSTFARRVLDLLQRQTADAGSIRGLQTMEVARREQANLVLATELMEDVEQMGYVVRDEGAADGAVRWFPNLFDEEIARSWSGVLV